MPPSTPLIAAYGAKYHKAAERLVKDRERLLSFYDFPAGSAGSHMRTTNRIESTFATVRLRTVNDQVCRLSCKTALGMAFKLILQCQAEMAAPGRSKFTTRQRIVEADSARSRDGRRITDSRRLIKLRHGLSDIAQG